MENDNLKTQLQVLQIIDCNSITKEKTVMFFDVPSNVVLPMCDEYRDYLKRLFPETIWVNGTGGKPSLRPGDWETMRKELKSINPNACNLDSDCTPEKALKSTFL